MIERLHAAVANVAPIVGISVGDVQERASWRVDFADDATPEQRAAAAAVIDTFDPDAPVVPQSVTPYQARMALHNAGMLPAVEALMAHPETDQAARLAWEYATVVERHSPFIAVLSPALGLSDQQIDNLFIAAAAI